MSTPGLLARLGAVGGEHSSYETIGEVTEAIHALLKESYNLGDQVPRIEEELQFVPKDREEVLYIYMYRVCQNPNLKNQRRLREAPISVPDQGVFYQRPPLILDVFYLIAGHAKFRSDAERLLGWTLLTMNDATRILYRPRRFVLPDGEAVDSKGRAWDPDANCDEDGLLVEKVSLALVDDLTVGDAINIFTMNEAPYRPYLTYRARLALIGPLTSAGDGTSIAVGDVDHVSDAKEAAAKAGVPETPPPGRTIFVPQHDPVRKPPAQSASQSERPSGRLSGGASPLGKRTPPGPKAHKLHKRASAETEPETKD
jgi:hypothetical protein